jgi:acetolactate synthase-1/2/3 large subunit
MNGAESLIRTLIAGGVDTCFTNPGTSEMHMVAALDRVTDKPACTLLHLGPGLANGVANLHNASRAQVPIVNIIGQHARYHLLYDAPLTSDIEAIARPYSKWLRTSSAASAIGRDAAEAIVAARTAPGQIATLIVPADVAWTDGADVAAMPRLPKTPLPSTESVNRAAAILRLDLPTALLLTGNALYGEGLTAAGRIATATGARLLAPYPITRVERGVGTPNVQRIPYMPEQATELLKDIRQLILVGATAPVSYFAYPGKSSVLTSPECEIHALANPGEDYVGALQALVAELSLQNRKLILTEKAERPPRPSGEITLAGLATAVGALLPENAIVVDEAMTSGRGMMAATVGSPPHDWLGNTGGSIGIALPLAVGAAVACPTRRVLCLTADGSSMYTLQALWSMAREALQVTTVVFANRTYAVLQREYAGMGVGSPGPRAAKLFDVGHPTLDWVHLAKGMGVASCRVATLDAFAKSVREGFETDGPTLIEVPL